MHKKGFYSFAAVPCPDLNTSPHLHVADTFSLTGHHFNDTVDFLCEEGYKMIGKSSLTCQSDEKWNYSPPSCERKSNDSGCNFI